MHHIYIYYTVFKIYSIIHILIMHTPVSYIAVGATGSDGSQYISD